MKLTILPLLVLSAVACRSTEPASGAASTNVAAPKPEIRYYEIADT